MFNTKALILSGLLALAAVLTVIFDDRHSVVPDSRIDKVLLSDEEVARVDKVIMSQKDKSVILSKDPSGAWRLSSHADTSADAGRVLQLFDELKRSRFLQVAATKKEQFGELGLADGTSLTVEVAGKPILTMIVGNIRNGGGGQYMAFEGESKAYLVDYGVFVMGEPDIWKTRTAGK